MHAIPTTRPQRQAKRRRRKIIISDCAISDASEMEANCLTSARSDATLDGSQIGAWEVPQTH